MRAWGLVAGLLVVVSSVSFSADEVIVGGANLNKPMSVRQMGAAGVGIGNGGVMAMWSNPAFLMNMETKGEVTLGAGVMNDGNESYTSLGGGWKLNDKWSVGGFFGLDGTSFEEIDGLGAGTGEQATDSTIAAGAVGAYRWKWLTAGLALKVDAYNQMEAKNTAPCGDLGLAGNWGPWSAGLSFRNLGGLLIQSDEGLYPDGVALPTEFRLGGAYHLPGLRLTPAMEFRKTTDRTAVLGIAAGWWANNWLALRAGISGPVGQSEALTEIQYAGSDNQEGGSPGFTMGLTALYKSFGFDFGFDYGAVGPSARVDVTYAIGERGNQPEAVREPEPEKQKEEVKEEPKQEEAPAPKPGDKKLNFAIADLRGENVSAGDAAVMADLLRNELVKTEQFTVIEKQNMDKVLSEHAFQQTGCSSEECAVKLGKLLNVQRMAVGSFGKLMDSYILSIRVVNVETGAIIFADSAEGEKVSQLRGGVKELAQRMAKKIR